MPKLVVLLHASQNATYYGINQKVCAVHANATNCRSAGLSLLGLQQSISVAYTCTLYLHYSYKSVAYIIFIQKCFYSHKSSFYIHAKSNKAHCSLSSPVHSSSDQNVQMCVRAQIHRRSVNYTSSY